MCSVNRETHMAFLVVFLALLSLASCIGPDFEDEIFNHINHFERPKYQLQLDDKIRDLARDMYSFQEKCWNKEKMNPDFQHKISHYEIITINGDLIRDLPTQATSITPIKSLLDNLPSLPFLKRGNKQSNINQDNRVTNTGPEDPPIYTMSSDFMKIIYKVDGAKSAILDPIYTKAAILVSSDKYNYTIVFLLHRVTTEGLYLWSTLNKSINFPVLENTTLSKYMSKQNLPTKDGLYKDNFKDYTFYCIKIEKYPKAEAIRASLNQQTAVSSATYINPKRLSFPGLWLKCGGKKESHCYLYLEVASATYEDASLRLLMDAKPKHTFSILQISTDVPESKVTKLLESQTNEILQRKTEIKAVVMEKAEDVLNRYTGSILDTEFINFLQDPATQSVIFKLEYKNSHTLLCSVTLLKYYGRALYSAKLAGNGASLKMVDARNADFECLWICSKFVITDITNLAEETSESLTNAEMEKLIINHELEDMTLISFQMTTILDGEGIQFEIRIGNLPLKELYNKTNIPHQLDKRLMEKAKLLVQIDQESRSCGPDCFVTFGVIDYNEGGMISCDETVTEYLKHWKPNQQDVSLMGTNVGYAGKLRFSTSTSTSSKGLPIQNIAYKLDVVLVFSTPLGDAIGNKLAHYEITDLQSTYCANISDSAVFVANVPTGDAIKYAVALFAKDAEFKKATQDKTLKCVGFRVRDMPNPDEKTVYIYFWTAPLKLLEKLNFQRPLADPIISNPFLMAFAESLIDRENSKLIMDRFPKWKENVIVKLNFQYFGNYSNIENEIISTLKKRPRGVENEEINSLFQHVSDLNNKFVGTAWYENGKGATAIFVFASIYDSVLMTLNDRYKDEKVQYTLYPNMNVFKLRYSKDKIAVTKSKELNNLAVRQIPVHISKATKLVYSEFKDEIAQALGNKIIRRGYIELGFIYDGDNTLNIFQIKMPKFRKFLDTINKSREKLTSYQIVQDYNITQKAREWASARCNFLISAITVQKGNNRKIDFPEKPFQKILVELTEEYKDPDVASWDFRQFPTLALNHVLEHVALESVGIWCETQSHKLYLVTMFFYDEVLEELTKIAGDKSRADDELNVQAFNYATKWCREIEICGYSSTRTELPKESFITVYEKAIPYLKAPTRGGAFKQAFSQRSPLEEANWKKERNYGFACVLCNNYEHVAVIISSSQKPKSKR